MLVMVAARLADGGGQGEEGGQGARGAETHLGEGHGAILDCGFAQISKAWRPNAALAPQLRLLGCYRG